MFMALSRQAKVPMICLVGAREAAVDRCVRTYEAGELGALPAEEMVELMVGSGGTCGGGNNGFCRRRALIYAHGVCSHPVA
jgi:hypothetical protein